ncbi:MAG: glycosyltransferase family 2 protein [Magnetococcales bacterium]|nr:glycosyltransferase family 2 protein [Magnetococcales bacterium]NGZ25660.1 glycosyltransferase family 2 protein [Magnetococcales bacterium]
MNRCYDLATVDQPALVLAEKQRQGVRVAMIAPAYNEGEKILGVVQRWPREMIDELLVVDDHSDDGSMAAVAQAGATVLTSPHQRSVGLTIAHGLLTAKKQGFDIAVVIAGNGKDDPGEVHRLLWPILMDGVDYVQGSRYMAGGVHRYTPLHRRILTRLYPLLVGMITGVWPTEATNGYRAYRLDVIDRAGMDLTQSWLSESLEYYIAAKVYLSSLVTAEVPVSKIYPQQASYASYTKIRPTKLFHRIMPLLLLRLGIRH